MTTGLAIAAIAAVLTVLAVRRFRTVHATFDTITDLGPASPQPGSVPTEYIPAFPEIDPVAQDFIPVGTGHSMCFRCETNPIPADGPSSLYCDTCRPIVAAIPAEPIERGSVR